VAGYGCGREQNEVVVMAELPLDAALALTWVGGYLFTALCLVAPPPSVQSLGLTVQAMCTDTLGSHVRNFLGYHVKYGWPPTHTHTHHHPSARQRLSLTACPRAPCTATHRHMYIGPRPRGHRHAHDRAHTGPAGEGFGLLGRRTLLTVVMHAVLAGGLGVLLVYLSWREVAWPAAWAPVLTSTLPLIGVALVVAAISVSLWMAWVWRHPSRHWIVRALRSHSPGNPTAVVAAINAEVQAGADRFQRTPLGMGPVCEHRALKGPCSTGGGRQYKAGCAYIVCAYIACACIGA
jgi:hypothetical protein